MKRFLFFFLLYLYSSVLDGQSLQHRFLALYSEVNATGRELIQIADSSYVITGYAYDSTYSFTNMVMIKTDKKGGLLWRKYFRFSTNYLDGISLKETSDGGFVIVGNQTTPTGTPAGLILRTDAGGNLLWSKRIANASLSCVSVTSDDFFIIVGSTYLSSSSDALVIKMNGLGAIVWTKKYGDTSYDYGSGVKVDALGNIYVSGNSGIGSQVLKLNSLGNILWSKKYVFPQYLNTWYIDLFSNGDILVGGVYDSTVTSANWHPLLYRINGDGDFLWARTYVGPWLVAESFSATITSDDGVVSDLEVEAWPGSGGGMRYGAFKTDGDGKLEWCHMYDSQDYGFPYGIIQTLDGGYASVGQKLNGICLTKTDENGFLSCLDTSVNLIVSGRLPIINSSGLESTGLPESSISLIQMDYFAPDSIYCIDSTFIVEEDISVVIPNVFTPNNDGINDYFFVTSKGIVDMNGAIFNRWGEKVAELRGVDAKWDGATKTGQPVSDGVYYYVIDLRRVGNGKINQKGFIQIIR